MLYGITILMKFFLLLLILTTPILGLTKDEMLKLSKLPHDSKNITAPIAFFPDIRTYHITMTIKHPENLPKNPEPIIAHEKVVNGEYLVSIYSAGLGKEKFDFIKVITYYAPDQCYKQWVYNQQLGTIYEYRGFRLGESNQISWHSALPLPEGAPQTITTNEYHKDHIVWTHQDYINGKLSFSMSGVSKQFSR